LLFRNMHFLPQKCHGSGDCNEHNFVSKTSTERQ
jgi:hypothetical protein